MRRLMTVILALLVLTGCVKTPTPAPAPSTEATTPPETKAPAPSTPEPVKLEPLPIDGALPVPLPEGMRPVELASGQAIQEPGLYYMDVATGRLEGWPFPASDTLDTQMGWAETAPDHQWGIFQMEKVGYLVRRTDGATFRFDAERFWVMPGPGRFLLAPRAWGEGQIPTYAILDHELKLLSTFSLPGARGHERFLFSPDGNQLAAALPAKGLARIDVATGQAIPVTSARGDGGQLSHHPDGFLLHTYATDQPRRLQWFDWEGRLQGEREGDLDLAFSPDGRLIASVQSMGDYGPAVVVQEVGSEKPLFRVAGATDPRWVANGTELIVSTRMGWQVVSTSGEMQPAPQAGEPEWHIFDWYLPAPENPDLFLTDTRVVDRTGRIVQATQLADGIPADVAGAGWGPTATEVHIVAAFRGGKGWEIGPAEEFLPGVQRPPFPEEYPLQVQDHQGQCLNLREEASKGARIIRCLPTGTRLAMTSSEIAFADELAWLTVETPAGETGWVAISTGSIAHAD